MNDVIKINKEDFIDALLGICLADHIGDVWDEVPKLTKPLGIDLKDPDELLIKLQEMGLIPEVLI